MKSGVQGTSPGRRGRGPVEDHAVPSRWREARGFPESPAAYGDDVLAQRHQRDRDHLEVRDRQWDSDDRDEQRDRGDDVADRQPDAGEDQPDDVADRRPRAGGRLVDDGPAERPQRVPRDPERRDAERNGDDEDAADDSRRDVAYCEPQASEDQPDDVEDSVHRVHLSTLVGSAGSGSSGHHGTRDARELDVIGGAFPSRAQIVRVSLRTVDDRGRVRYVPRREGQGAGCASGRQRV
jgi:hypothetical protein